MVFKNVEQLNFKLYINSQYYISELAIAYVTYKKKYCFFKKIVFGQLRNCPKLPGKEPQDLLLCYRVLQKALAEKGLYIAPEKIQTQDSYIYLGFRRQLFAETT